MAQTEGTTAFPSAKGATPSQPSPTGWVRDRSEGQRAEGPTYPPPIPNPSFTNQNRREPRISTHGKAHDITQPLGPSFCEPLLQQEPKAVLGKLLIGHGIE